MLIALTRVDLCLRQSPGGEEYRNFFRRTRCILKGHWTKFSPIWPEWGVNNKKPAFQRVGSLKTAKKQSFVGEVSAGGLEPSTNGFRK